MGYSKSVIARTKKEAEMVFKLVKKSIQKGQYSQLVRGKQLAYPPTGNRDLMIGFNYTPSYEDEYNLKVIYYMAGLLKQNHYFHDDEKVKILRRFKGTSKSMEKRNIFSFWGI